MILPFSTRADSRSPATFWKLIMSTPVLVCGSCGFLHCVVRGSEAVPRLSGKEYGDQKVTLVLGVENTGC